MSSQKILQFKKKSRQSKKKEIEKMIYAQKVKNIKTAAMRMRRECLGEKRK